MVVIKWKVFGKDEVFVSPNMFTLERAKKLVEMANRDFVRAHHWYEAA